MRTATTTLASLLAAAMLVGGTMGTAAQVPADDGIPARLQIDITITGPDEPIQVEVDEAGDGATAPPSPAVLAQLEALAAEYPYLGLHDGVRIARDHGRLPEFADRFPYMAAEQ